MSYCHVPDDIHCSSYSAPPCPPIRSHDYFEPKPYIVHTREPHFVGARAADFITCPEIKKPISMTYRSIKGESSVSAQQRRLETRLAVIASHEKRVMAQHRMTPELLRDWILNLPSFVLPDNSRYNRILNDLADAIIITQTDGIMFDQILRDQKLEDFKVSGAHGRSFIGKKIADRWVKTFGYYQQ